MTVSDNRLIERKREGKKEKRKKLKSIRMSCAVFSSDINQQLSVNMVDDDEAPLIYGVEFQVEQITDQISS